MKINKVKVITKHQRLFYLNCYYNDYYKENVIFILPNNGYDGTVIISLPINKRKIKKYDFINNYLDLNVHHHINLDLFPVMYFAGTLYYLSYLYKKYNLKLEKGFE